MNSRDENEVNIPFPFPPYEVQKQLMNAIVDACDKGGVLICESPTGTGKSLSAVCSLLYWLLERTRGGIDPPDVKANESEEQSSGTGTDPSWMTEYLEKNRAQEMKENEERREKRRKKRIEKLSKWVDEKKKEKKQEVGKKRRDIGMIEDEDEEFLIHWSKNNDESISEQVIFDSDEWKSLFEKDSISNIIDTDEEQEEEIDRPIQILYCTRTHSQIRQLLSEVRKTAFASQVRCIPLSSRKHLCVNPSVNALSSVQSMNEKCQDLRSGKTSSSKTEATKSRKVSLDQKRKVPVKSACSYLNPTTQRLLADSASEKVLDVEDLHKLGTNLHGCSYYAVRVAAETAHMVVMPYQSLLHESQRQALNLDLKNSIVFIDEAHNLVEAINDIHTCRVTKEEVYCARWQIDQYLEKYETRLNSLNAMMIRRIGYVIKQIEKYFETITLDKEFKVRGVTEFLFKVKIDNQNLFELAQFLTESRLVHKVKGFIKKWKQNEVPETNNSALSLNAIQYALEKIKELFLSLTRSEKEGRLILSSSTLTYTLLNPSNPFAAIYQQARTVILAGGTMRPYDHYVTQLFPTSLRNQISFFSCGHVIPPSNLKSFALTYSNSNTRFDFTYASRASTPQLEQLFEELYQICEIVPGGVVCFFTSYAYEKYVISYWAKTSRISRLAKIKPLFREDQKSPKSSGSVLARYIARIERNPEQGALLSCVIGGKLSEGINFSNELARCVVVVGLPYASAQDPLLKERMTYLDQEFGKGKGRQLYETLCARAVNQSIGRAIRHKNDYSTIVLIDSRYSCQRIVDQIPEWIRKSLELNCTPSQLHQGLRRFFQIPRQ